MTARIKTGRPGWFWVLVAFGFCFALGSGLQMQRNQHGVDDFNQFYVGARLAFTGHLYDPAAQRVIDHETVGADHPDFAPSRLPFYYVLLSPLGHVPFAIAGAIWFALMIVASILFVLVYPTRDRAALAAATAASLPLFAATFGQRQDLGLVLLMIAIVMRLHARGRGFAAGLVLALLAIKINLFFLLPIALVMRREWRMLGGLAVGGTALLGISFAAAGPHWIQDYLTWMATPVAMSGITGMPNLHGVLDGPLGWEVALSAAVIVAVVVAGRRNGFELAFSAALLGSFLVSHHAYLHDCAVLIPGLVEIVTRGRGRSFTTDSENDRACTAPSGRGSGRIADAGGILAWGLAVALLTPFPYFLPPLLIHVREGVVPVLLIGATLAFLTQGENKA